MCCIQLPSPMNKRHRGAGSHRGHDGVIGALRSERVDHPVVPAAAELADQRRGPGAQRCGPGELEPSRAVEGGVRPPAGGQRLVAEHLGRVGCGEDPVGVRLVAEHPHHHQHRGAARGGVGLAQWGALEDLQGCAGRAPRPCRASREPLQGGDRVPQAQQDRVQAGGKLHGAGPGYSTLMRASSCISFFVASPPGRAVGLQVRISCSALPSLVNARLATTDRRATLSVPT